jgi:hypothetical protein
MRAAGRDAFSCVKTEGGLLPADFLRRVSAGDPFVPGLSPEDYHLGQGEKIAEAISRSWNRLLGVWRAFKGKAEALAEADPGTALTRERWLLVVFQELGYGRLAAAGSPEIDGKSYPISHEARSVPVHLVGWNVDLDRRTQGVAGAARTSPHGLVQEFLNRSPGHLWGVVSNGRKIRILRDNKTLTRQAYVEFDLETMMEDEVYPDFALFWLVGHESSLQAEKPESCRFERWTELARETGTRALDSLRDGVKRAIEILGMGFLSHPANTLLRDKLRRGELSGQDFYRQLLRVVYKLLFLLAAEDRDLLFPLGSDPVRREIYRKYYSAGRLRTLAERTRGGKHADLWRAVRIVFDALGGHMDGSPLGLPVLGSFLWSREAAPDLQGCDLSNRELLSAVFSLSFMTHPIRQKVDLRNLGAEELGSIYESLLEMHPEISAQAGSFTLVAAGGSERKTTGSYYTPASLVGKLLDSALEPVLEEAARGKNPETAILDLRVCDPACGSGHFLIAAAHRMARRLAAVRSGGAEPSPGEHRRALRDVIGKCIYGVDLNPMAVELCKVNLWMEALEPGRPLSFLEAHIKCGNSLLGATPALVRKGIPEEAFDAIEGDDKKFCAEYRKRNKRERKGSTRTLFDATGLPWDRLGKKAAEKMNVLYEVDDSTIQGVREKQARYGEFLDSEEYKRLKNLADAWCAAFLWEKRKNEKLPWPVTQEILSRLEITPESVPDWMRVEITSLTSQYGLFHWHVEFPDIFEIPTTSEEPAIRETGWTGGFDVVLGNPPWEHTELKEEEYFAVLSPEIANAKNAAIRKKKISELAKIDPALYLSFSRTKRQHDTISHFVRNTGRYPLCGLGRINTFAIFAETMRSLMNSRGRLGCIVPSGIATDDTTKDFFRDLVEKGSLVSLHDFENRKKLFPAVDSRIKFCLLTLTGPGRPAEKGADFLFFAHDASDLDDQDRHFVLSAGEIKAINPNTATCPIFRTKRDAEITRKIYEKVPVLINEQTGENPWGITFRQGLFNMASNSNLFRTHADLESDGWTLEGNIFRKGNEKHLPLYEAKMVHQYNHRFGDYADLPEDSKSTQLPDVPLDHLRDTAYDPLPRYWVHETEVTSRLADRWPHSWLLGWRDICRSTDERTMIAGLIPRVGVGHKYLLIFPSSANLVNLPFLAANLGTYILDYAARQKLGGTSMAYFVVRQLPILPPEIYSTPAPWSPMDTLAQWMFPRVFELIYTSESLRPFAKDLGHEGPPFTWDPERRFQLRCELDAAFFHLYSIPRPDVDYIMETFPIVMRKDIAAHRNCKTKDTILQFYDLMNENKTINSIVDSHVNVYPDIRSNVQEQLEAAETLEQQGKWKQSLFHLFVAAEEMIKAVMSIAVESPAMKAISVDEKERRSGIKHLLGQRLQEHEFKLFFFIAFAKCIESTEADPAHFKNLIRQWEDDAMASPEKLPEIFARGFIPYLRGLLTDDALKEARQRATDWNSIKKSCLYIDARHGIGKKRVSKEEFHSIKRRIAPIIKDVMEVTELLYGKNMKAEEFIIRIAEELLKSNDIHDDIARNLKSPKTRK